MEIIKFRGYVNEDLKYVFPLHWIYEIIPQFCGSALVRYYDGTKGQNKENNTELTEIEVDYINIK